MSQHGKYGSSRDDSRRSGSRRDSSPSSRHGHSRNRRSSPGPSRERSPPRRDERDLPQQFGRVPEEHKDDDLTVIQRMKTSYIDSPLGGMNKCIDGSRKVKVYTRNFKEVRGICTGYVTAFDKHWNLIMKDVDEVYLKPRKSKTPFLRDVTPYESIPEMEPKVPRQKKENAATAVEETEEVVEETEDKPVEETEDKPVEETEDKPVEVPAEKKAKRKRKKGPTTEKRHVSQMFVRGDNIVMIAIMKEDN